MDNFALIAKHLAYQFAHPELDEWFFFLHLYQKVKNYFTMDRFAILPFKIQVIVVTFWPMKNRSLFKMHFSKDFINIANSFTRVRLMFSS